MADIELIRNPNKTSLKIARYNDGTVESWFPTKDYNDTYIIVHSIYLGKECMQREDLKIGLTLEEANIAIENKIGPSPNRHYRHENNYQRKKRYGYKKRYNQRR